MFNFEKLDAWQLNPLHQLANCAVRSEFDQPSTLNDQPL